MVVKKDNLLRRTNKTKNVLVSQSVETCSKQVVFNFGFVNAFYSAFGKLFLDYVFSLTWLPNYFKKHS